MNKKLGYYVCNGIEFESKISAMIYAQATNLPITWVFNNDVFDNYAWHNEPELTLDQLYDQRARQIREEYDYVILSYSGGSDSNNILESFLRQGLHIDEIVSNWALDASDKFMVLNTSERSTWNNNAEFRLHTASRLEYIRNASPRTKITMLDTSKLLIETFLRADDASWTKNKKEVLNATGSTLYNYVYFSEIRKQFDKNKRIALIIGTDKPKLKIINNKLYFFFVDKSVNMVSLQDHIAEYPNAEPISFYWAPECCDMLAKQGHIVLKHIQANPQLKSVWESDDPKIIRRVQEELLKTIVYSTWNPNWFQVYKSLGDWDSELDYWFTRGWHGTKEYEIWLSGIKHVAKKIPKFLTFEDNGSVKGTEAFRSPKYFIGNT